MHYWNHDSQTSSSTHNRLLGLRPIRSPLSPPAQPAASAQQQQPQPKPPSQAWTRRAAQGSASAATPGSAAPEALPSTPSPAGPALRPSSGATGSAGTSSRSPFGAVDIRIGQPGIQRIRHGGQAQDEPRPKASTASQGPAPGTPSSSAPSPYLVDWDAHFSGERPIFNASGPFPRSLSCKSQGC